MNEEHEDDIQRGKQARHKYVIYVSSTDYSASEISLPSFSNYARYPSKFFSALQSYCPCLSVILLSYDGRSTLIRLDRRKKFGRAAAVLSQSMDEFSIQILTKLNVATLH